MAISIGTRVKVSFLKGEYFITEAYVAGDPKRYHVENVDPEIKSDCTVTEKHITVLN